MLLDRTTARVRPFVMIGEVRDEPTTCGDASKQRVAAQNYQWRQKRVQPNAKSMNKGLASQRRSLSNWDSDFRNISRILLYFQIF
jgi:hypothetical protein